MAKAALALLLGLLAVLAAAEDPSDPSFLLNRIYRTWTEASESPCVLVLSENGTIGCGEAFPVRAPLLIAETQRELSAFIASTDGESKAVVLSAVLFTRDTVDSLVATGRCAGILVAYSEAPPQLSWSPADPNPNQLYGLRPSQFYAWNPVGNSWAFDRQKVPIFYLSNDSATEILEMARNQYSSYPKWVAEFNAEMWATQDSRLCLDRSFCLPVGGQSTWATLAPLVPSKDTVMVVAGLDSNAFFHANTRGAVSSVSGAAAALGAYVALSQLSPETIAEWDYQLVFAFFQGEAWGYSGSKRFVEDIQSFTCKSGETENGCADPFKTSLEFTKIKFENIRYLIEAKQVGSPASQGLSLHTEKPVSAATSQLLSALRSSNVDTVPVAESTPGVPPSSSHSFLLQNPQLPAVVIADHSAEYANLYYDSDWDVFPNVDTGLVCEAAKMIASGVLSLVGHPQPEDNGVNCTLVAAFVQCLASNLSCAAASQWTGYEYSFSFSNYVGVFQWTDSYTMPTDFVWRVLNGTMPANATVQLHDALSPAFTYDENSAYWKVVDSTALPTWTESFWNTLSLRVFLQESWTADAVILVAGVLATTVFTVALLFTRQSLGFTDLTISAAPQQSQQQQQQQRQQAKPAAQPPR